MALIDDVAIVLPNVAAIDEVTVRLIRRSLAKAMWEQLDAAAEERIHVRLWEAHARIRVRDLTDVWEYLLGPRR